MTRPAITAPPAPPNPSDRGEGAADHLLTIDPELRELVPTYLERRKKDIQTLKEAWVKEDWKTFELVGHRLRGNAASFGFHPLALIGGDMEVAARSGELTRLKELTSRFEKFLENLQIKYA